MAWQVIVVGFALVLYLGNAARALSRYRRSQRSVRAAGDWSFWQYAGLWALPLVALGVAYAIH